MLVRNRGDVEIGRALAGILKRWAEIQRRNCRLFPSVSDIAIEGQNQFAYKPDSCVRRQEERMTIRIWKSTNRKQRKSSLGKPIRMLALTLSLAALTGLFLVRGSPMLGGGLSLALFHDSTGYVGTVSTSGPVDTKNPFFQSLGTNGRACVTCHMPNDAWGITPLHIRRRFAATHGRDPLFRPVDGSNCPDSPGVNNSPPPATAYGLLLNKGLIRVSLPIPSNAEFTVRVVSDPYGCALTGSSAGQTQLSMYRRPLPATNLGFLSAVMWDGRESFNPLSKPVSFQSNLQFDLAHQAVDATLGHAQAAVTPSPEQVEQIVAFETSTYTAQVIDDAAGVLLAQGAQGGPVYLSHAPYYPGINDSLGGDPNGLAFDPGALTLFASWQGLAGKSWYTAARQSIARGEVLFNSAPLTIQDVKGLNDTLGVASIAGTCSTCHDTPSVGNHSLPLPLDLGLSDTPADSGDPLAGALAELNPPLTPVFEFSCSTSLGAPANVTVQTSDPGRAMITGHCADIGKFKGPVLRGLAARPPYFHNGSADSLDQLVSFYNKRFQAGLTANQMADLVAFLRSL
jgi:hypothetical protein